MSKQEEIREGIINIVRLNFQFTPMQQADQVLNYLHSKSVVIKVDRELPENPVTEYQKDIEAKFPIYTAHMRTHYEDMERIHNEIQQTMLKAGYVTVEPLIGGE